jgi:uncharacterized membrane protein YphA (DoxX/SURF4 family)
MGVAAAAAIVILAGALRVEPFLRTAERRWLGALPRMAAELGPLVLRLGMAVMLALAGTGGLPRHGRPFGPSRPSSSRHAVVSGPGWAWLSGVQLALALVLAAGFLTRLAGLVLAALALAGLGAFGSPFLDYAPHFIAPGLILVILGAGRLSIDHALGSQGVMQPRTIGEGGLELALA